MALKTPYLAAEGSAARRSRALHRFTVASPLMILLAVGMVGHVRRAPLAQPARMAEYDRNVLAYQERVAAVRTMSNGDSEPAPSTLKTEARRWIDGYDSGLLKPLKPAYFEDHLQNGARGEVMRAALTLSTLLCTEASHDLDRGKATEAAKTAMLAAGVTRGVRDFEVQSFLQSLLEQRRATAILNKAWPKISAKEKVALIPELQNLKAASDDVERLRQQDIAQLNEYRRRQAVEDEGSLLRDSQESARQQDHALERSIRLSNERVDELLADAS